MNKIQILLQGFILVALLGCSVHRSAMKYDTKGLPFQLEIYKDSREAVLTQTQPWEEQMIGYFKVLKMADNDWQMWYSSWDNKRKDDYSDFLVYAYSKDGKHWTKEIPGKSNNILRGSGHPQKDGIVEQDVFILPDATYKYKMIYTAKDTSDHGREKTYIEESKDGVNWTGKKVLWNEKYDSQFSVIPKNDRFHIYLRHWEIKNKVRYRTIGLAVTDTSWNTVQEPRNILKADFEGDYPHLYNPAASQISNDLDILFPTFFNEKNNAIKFGVGYVYKNNPVLTDLDITEALLDSEASNWGIISPGLVITGKNTYWLYYYATNMKHSDYDQSGRKFKYYRIKIKIRER